MSSKQFHTFNQAFITESGASIPRPTVAYQSWGQLNDARDNVVLVCHALTGNTAADKWFSGLFGAGKILDPEQHFIICPNTLGSCYGTTGPASINSETGKKYRTDFPRITIRDMVRLQQQLLDALAINGIELVIGGSMGGMQTLEWCLMDDRPKSAAVFGMGKRHRPWAIGISHTQRQAIFNDPNWNNGYYSDDAPPNEGLALARMIAMNSYRHPVDFDEKFGRRRQDSKRQYQVESYLNYQGEKFVDRFDAVSYIRLTQAMDTHDIARTRPNFYEKIKQLKIPIVVVGIDSDRLYPPEEVKELANLIPRGHYQELCSPHGHDAFLIEFQQLNQILQSLTPSIQKQVIQS